ncbi:MAG: hypothetical protein FWB83_10415, partial [Treponema sp.]|nr:hypothetical protein [Treponema sp.]
MRFFIFPLDNIHIAVAADKVKCFISLDNVQEDSYQAEPGQIKIPIYIVFGKSRGENISCHGIVLKQKTSRDETLVIITPHIEKDINIDEKEIQSLPGCFSDVYSSFSG